MYSLLTIVFCIIVTLANLLSAKMVPLGGLLLPVGLFFYPLTFLISDLVTEIYGAQKAKQIVYTTLAMQLIAFGMVQLALFLPAQSEEIERSFQAIFGLSSLRIFSSLSAYCVSQFIGIQLYALIRRWTGSQFLWLRANGSAGISQIIDTLLLDLLYLYGGLGIAFFDVFRIMLFTLGYKLLFSLALTPLFYFSVFLIRNQRLSN